LVHAAERSDRLMSSHNTVSRTAGLSGGEIADLSTGRLRRALRTATQLGASGVVGLARRHGFRESLHFAARNVRHMIAHRIALRWDRKYGVDTAGSIQLAALSVKGPNRKFGNECVCTSPKSFDFMMRCLPADLQDYTFVDFGSGKSRTVLLASRYNLGKIIGVEFAKELVDCARTNIARFNGAWQSCRDLEIVEADATEFVVPDKPLVIFFYNPFARKVFDTVLQNIVASLTTKKRACYIIYGSSSHDAIGWAAPAILASGHFETMAAEPMPVFFDSVRTIRYAAFRSL
jgi:hypothetical protein